MSEEPGKAPSAILGASPIAPDTIPYYEPVRPQADYLRSEVMIPMRDGVRLLSVIVMRKGVRNAPILLTRTAYDARKTSWRNPSQRIVEILPVMDAEFVNDGYIRVYQDIRGLGKSEGDYVMNRPLVGALNDSQVDHSTDAWDTIEWLVKNVPESNGRVAAIGSSYNGFTALMSLIDPHPALKAAVPQSPMVDCWIGDDWFHNGAFRQPSFEYVVQQTAKLGSGPVPYGTGDAYDAYLAAGSASSFARLYGLDAFPFVQKLIDHPTYDDFWRSQAMDKIMAQRGLTVPTMLVVGQWDQEDSYGAPALYRALKPQDGNNDLLILVIGPWRHSGFNYEGSKLGPLSFEGDTALQFRCDLMKPFLDHHLKAPSSDPVQPAIDVAGPSVFTYATGINRWQATRDWPAGAATPIYLQADNLLGFHVPEGGHDEYVSDPSKPVPFVPRPIHLRDDELWKPWLVSDQRFVADRTDVLSYRTAALDHAVQIAGAPRVDLFASTSGADSDWVVKLIDVYPEESSAQPRLAGYHLPIGIEIFRGRYVHGFSTPAALTPNKVENYQFELPNVNHVFLPGHRIMVQIQSSLFPLYDRNPQTFVPNIFNASPDDYRPATQRIYHSPDRASAIWLPVVSPG